MEEKISSYELFSVIFLVPYGSAVFFFNAAEAEQSSWLVILIYIIPGLLLQYIYISLYRNYPEETIINWMVDIFGRLLGGILAILYAVYFAYIAARVLRDFITIIKIVAGFSNSVIILNIVLLGTVVYGVSKGVENMCRLASSFFLILNMVAIILLFLFFSTPNIVHWHNLLPIFPKGIVKPVLKSWRLVTFPYGETIIATMLYSKVNNQNKIKRAAFAAIIVEGVMLAFISICYIIGLGANFASKANFPLMGTLRLIRIAGFLDRMDLFIIVILTVNAFIKIGMFMYCAVASTSQILGIKINGALVFTMGVIISVAAYYIAENFIQHLYIGLDFTPKYIHFPMQIFIPVLALIVSHFKKGSRKKKLA